MDERVRTVMGRTAALHETYDLLVADGGLSIEPSGEAVSVPPLVLDASTPDPPDATAAPSEPSTTVTTTTNTTSARTETTTVVTNTTTKHGWTSTTTVTTNVIVDVTTSTTTTTTSTWDQTSVAVPTAALRSRRFLCKLINGTDNDDPTPNAMQTRFNLRGTDLGVPLVVDGQLYLFFGDTMGYQTIWPIGEADAVARIPLESVRLDPTSVCRELDVYVTADNPSVAHADDPAVLRDFAGGYILTGEGDDPSDYLSLAPPGLPNVPGALEVPAGALRAQDGVYLFYAGAATMEPFAHATLSFVTRWEDRSRTAYRVVRALDSLESGALGGHFIQVAPLRSGDMTYLFGTGVFRRSAVYLARTRSVEDPKATEIYSPDEKRWTKASTLSPAARSGIQPIVEAPGVGELSAFYVAEVGLYGLLYQRELRNLDGAISDNRVIVRFARQPEGPWSEPVTLSDMLDWNFLLKHCCGETCQGDQLLHCDRAGLYAAYALPTYSYADGVLRLPYLVSTWDPYNVVLFEAEIVLH